MGMYAKMMMGKRKKSRRFQREGCRANSRWRSLVRNRGRAPDSLGCSRPANESPTGDGSEDPSPTDVAVLKAMLLERVASPAGSV